MKPKRPTKSKAIQPAARPGFDGLLRELHLRNTRTFYTAFPIWDALRSELNWTHYRTLLRVEDEQAREWYANEAITENWSSRALERQVARLYYDRLLSSKERKTVRAEAEEKIAELPASPRDFVRDPVLLELIREQRLMEDWAQQSEQPRRRVPQRK